VTFTFPHGTQVTVDGDGNVVEPQPAPVYVCPHCGNESDDEAVITRCMTCHPKPQPAPGLAAAMAETRKVQDILAAILSQFAKGSSGWTARVGQVPLARAWAATREPVPDELRMFL
jgi:predicted RNA-binding Zn-ribbon protein involved in translation (DUF1610 family)